MRRAVLWAAAALLVALAASGPARARQYYGGEYWWGCTYSWGSPCIEPHYETAIHFLQTMDPDHAASWLEAETENRYKAPRRDGIERCVGGTVWDGSQTEPWSGGWGIVQTAYPSGPPGYGVIGSCEPYYGISLYQYVNWGEN